MKLHPMRLAVLAIGVSALLFWPAAAAGQGFAESFAQGPAGNKWVFGADPTNSLRWAAEPAAKCLQFASAASATAHAPWAALNQPDRTGARTR